MHHNKKKDISLSYYCYDWDDNILHMDTKIIMEKIENDNWIETEVSTTDFASFRKLDNYRIPMKNGNPDYDKAYSNFRDNKEENIFLKDMIEALEKKAYAPSFSAFKRCLINGELFSIVSARGNEPQTLKDAILYFINNELTVDEKAKMKVNLLKFYKIFNEKMNGDIIENYLKHCDFIGVNSNYFKELLTSLNIKDVDYSNVELLKKYAISYIVDKIHFKYKYGYDHIIKIGFSDDDKANIHSIKSLFENELKKQNTDTHFVVYDTSKIDDNNKNYIKHII